MIRFVHCMKRRPELTVPEFREYWNSQEFLDLNNRLEELLEPVRISKNLTYNVDINTVLMQERGSEEPFDGIMEVWLESGTDLHKIQDSEEGDQIRAEMEAFQKKFVDFSKSIRFFTESI